MELLDAIESRRAVRSYTAEPVDAATLNELVHIAVQAPSAMNHQPWRFVVVRGAPYLRELGVLAARHARAHLPPESPLAQHLADAGVEIFHGAPALVLVCAEHDEPQAIEDCCLAAMVLMLAAHGSGLGTCWIGLSRPWANSPEGRAALELPASHVAVAPIVIGYPAVMPAPSPRRPPELLWRTSSGAMRGQ
jgi:nitroreductase